MKRLVIENKEQIADSIRGYFESNPDAKFIHRLHGILLLASKEEESCDSVARLFGNSPRSVSNWVKKLNASGNIESLRDKKRQGRPRRLNSLQETELKKVLQLLPEESGMTCNIWDGKSLSAYIKANYGVEMKVRACQNLFHKLGFNLKRARPAVCKGDSGKKEVSKKT